MHMPLPDTNKFRQVFFRNEFLLPISLPVPHKQLLSLVKDYDIQKPVWLTNLHGQFQIYLFFLQSVPMNQPKVALPFVLWHFLYK